MRAETRSEIRHLRALAGVTNDAEVLAAIDELIRELERRIYRAGAEEA